MKSDKQPIGDGGLEKYLCCNKELSAYVFFKKKDLLDLKNDFISWKIRARKSSRKNEQKIKGRK